MAASQALAAIFINIAMRTLDQERKTPASLIVRFLNEEAGQDVLEYALLLAFIALAGAAALLNMSGSTNTLWSVANSNLAAANAGS